MKGSVELLASAMLTDVRPLDNRDFADTNTAQKLTEGDIRKMKNSGKGGQAIIQARGTPRDTSARQPNESSQPRPLGSVSMEPGGRTECSLVWCSAAQERLTITPLPSPALYFLDRHKLSPKQLLHLRAQ